MSAPTFYFYDLETSGINARSARIMQFAGQRTDMGLNPLGEMDNILVKLSADVLPEPDAVMVHGITPQKAATEGITEAELVKYLTSQVFLPDTIVVGYNNIRFDDEFIRHLFWRNFTDPYEWQWKDGCSKWDLLDVVRMTRALRPHGIEWSFASDGRASNRLEDLASVNKLDHTSAHDAGSDVEASIQLAKLLKTKQPKIFEYLLNIKGKDRVAALVGKGDPFLYTSGRYYAELEKTTIAVSLGAIPDRGAALVYDLRVDPSGFTDLNAEQLSGLWKLRGRDAPYFPIKEIKFNRCPAVAPVSVLDGASAERLQIDARQIDVNLTKLKGAEDFGDKLLRARELLQPVEQSSTIVDPQKVDEQLYDGFVAGSDKTKMSVVRAADVSELAGFHIDFTDARLDALLPLYKARNYPKSLDGAETQAWREYIKTKLMSGGPESLATKYFARLAELAKTGLNGEKQFLLEELQLYGEAVVPFEM